MLQGKLIKLVAAVAGAVCALLFAGCVSVPMTSESDDARAKGFVPEPGKASIYIIRGHPPGFGLVFTSGLDGREAGWLGPDTYHLLSVRPGEHAVAVKSPNYFDEVKIKVLAGQNYFFYVSGPTFTGRIYLRELDDREGRRTVLRKKRAMTRIYE